MPDNVELTDEQKATIDARETIRRGLTMVSNVVHARQSQMGYWPAEDGKQVDYRVFFAELHSKVASAYETYKEELDPTHLIWIDPATGDEVEPGKGVPQGLSMDLVDIVFDILGFATNVGINVGDLSAGVAIAMRAAPPVVMGEVTEGEMEVEGEGEGDNTQEGVGEDEDDFDLEAILATDGQMAPTAVEIEVPVAEEKKPEGAT